ncbi:hypothetical protein DV737_g3837, partial [Chaetothyriales sp. CBS 132003]
MARYLTPSKVALLALGLLYHEGVVPTSESTVVLSFLLAHILPDSKHAASAIEDLEHILPISVFETALSKHVSIMPGRAISDLLLKRLWAIDCSDALDHFFQMLPGVLAKSRGQILMERETGVTMAEGTYGRIVRTSPLGAFIRRCHLEYTRLQFQDAITLWQDFIIYRAPTRQQFERKNPPHGHNHNLLDANLAELQIDTSHPLAHIMYRPLLEPDKQLHYGYSTRDIEKLMEFQVSEMQRLGARLPEAMRNTLANMSKSGYALPKLSHYLKFLDSWRAGDYTSAYDSLRRYFDYTMQSRDRTFYQYALLNLAILQADFGCFTEAIPAMQEAIATARENRDTMCLNFCMSWLYHFGRTMPAEMKNIKESGILGSEIEGLQFLKSRARDAEMWSLLSTSLLSEAKLGLQHGDSLAAVFENIVKASHINVTKATQNIGGPALLIRASAFARVGLTHLAWSCSETFLQCYAQDAPVEDVLKCRCRMASLLTQQGKYTEAEAIMSEVSPGTLTVLKYKNYCTFYSGLLKLRRCIHRDDLNTAELVASQLEGQGAPDFEIGFSLAFLQIEVSIRRGNLQKALERVEKLAERTETDNPDVAVHARLLNLKARILALAGRPLKGFSLVMKAAQINYRARVLPALWESTTILANVLIAAKEEQGAIELLQAIMPQVLEYHDCDLIARAYSCLADAFIALAGSDEGERKGYVSKAMEYLDTALQQWKFVEDLKGQLDVLYKKSTVMHWRGDMQLANEEAAKYLEVRRAYEKANG